MGTETKDESRPFDTARKFVRVCRERADGFVEFEFAIGDPALCVELLLPAAAFADFCCANGVTMLDPAGDATGDWVARLNDASRRHIEDAN